jgi:hypothetical protein
MPALLSAMDTSQLLENGSGRGSEASACCLCCFFFSFLLSLPGGAAGYCRY